MQIKILIVEDDKFLRDLMVHKCELEGFLAIPVVSGEEALKKVKSEHPNLILLDLLLPGIDGFCVLRSLKKDMGALMPPVVVFSNRGEKEDRDRAFAEGAEEFMVKAHTAPNEVMNKIKSILKKQYF